MSSEKVEKNQTEPQAPADQGPVFCLNGCGFYGNPMTKNYCSKCYKDVGQTLEAEEKKQEVPPSVTVENETELVTKKRKKQKKKNRCYVCKKKVGILGFECRCEFVFCSSHRYPEEHECDFDVKQLQRDIVAKANPVVKASKLERI